MTHVLFVQTGDFGEAFTRFNDGGAETYHDQKKSVDFVRELAPTYQISVASISSDPYDRSLAPGLRAIGVQAERFHSRVFGTQLIEECAPDVLVARLPHFSVLEATVAHKIPSFPCLADIFDSVKPSDILHRTGIRKWRHNRRMRQVFSAPSITAVGNHSLSASQSLEHVLGVDPRRITPWEWSRIVVPETPKQFPGNRPFEILYVGTLSEQKGVGDLLEAMRNLENQSPGRVRLTIAGEGPEAERFRNLAAAPEMPSVTFLGQISKAEVRNRMAASDLVVVPSRPSYAEGLPNAVVEGLGLRVPLVVAHHSSIRDRLTHETDVLICRSLDPIDMASQIYRLTRDSKLYERLSQNSAVAYDRLFVGASWYELVGAFLDDPLDHSGWVLRHSLKSIEDDRKLKK